MPHNGPYEPPDLLVTDEIKRRFDALMVKYGLPPIYGTQGDTQDIPRTILYPTD